ncbi:MAG: malonate transporter [Pseudomonadota bacterium]|jgi:malonate transporter
MLTVLEVTLPVFALVLCGWVAARRGLLAAGAVEGLNTFVFWFALPAMLYRAVATQPITRIVDGRFFAAFLGAGLLLYAGTLWAARRRGASERTALAFSTTHGNVGYLGLPLLAQLGDDRRLPGMVMAMMADICVLIVLSIVLFEFGRGGPGADVPLARRLRQALGGLLRTPLILGIVAGFAAAATGLALPAPAESFVRLLAQAAGPCALFAIGASLGGRAVIVDRTVTALIVAKLALHPALVAVAMVLLGTDPALAAIGVLAASLPTASNTFILSQRYGVDPRAIGSAIVVGTFAAAATVSFVIWLLGLRLA